jgi:hypothetical protein
LGPWETGDNPIVLDPEVIKIDDSESKEDGSISNIKVDDHEEGDRFLEVQVPTWDWEDMEGPILPKVYGHRRKKRSRLVPFLGDLGQRLLIHKDPSSSGKIKWEKSGIYLQLG